MRSLQYEQHARDQMRWRGITEADVERVCESFDCFKRGRDYCVNLWGRGVDGRVLRITVIPEIPLVVTVADVNCVMVHEMLEHKSEASAPHKAPRPPIHHPEAENRGSSFPSR